MFNNKILTVYLGGSYAVDAFKEGETIEVYISRQKMGEDIEMEFMFGLLSKDIPDLHYLKRLINNYIYNNDYISFFDK